VVRALKISGFAKQLAERAELVRLEGQRILLRIPPAARQLAGYRDKLRGALEEQWGTPLAVEIEVAETSIYTVTSEDARREESALAAARATMESDPFVNELISGFGATIESVQAKSEKPIQGAAQNPREGP
jgi:DNA polymerase III subunit gamma/tau